jgi:hypothetical protein
MQTGDVSRSGLLISTNVPHAPAVPPSVAFPYDSSIGHGQPEILARVVRCEEVPEVIRSADARKSSALPGVLWPFPFASDQNGSRGSRRP